MSSLPDGLREATGVSGWPPSSLLPLGLLAWIWGSPQESRSLLGGREH